MGAAPALDIARGRASCAENADIHREVVGILVNDIDARIAALAGSLGQGDLPAAAGLSHKNKGACLTVGALALAELFNTVDHACRRGDRAAAESSFALLAEAATAFKAAAAAL